MDIKTTTYLAVLPLMLSTISWSADFAKGQAAYDEGNYEAARVEWQQLADEENADGQFGMGLLYDNGFAVEFNSEQALIWYQAAADQGHGVAQCNLAVMYENGWGVAQSDADAFKWYTLSAEQGVTLAQRSLAKMYKNGYGVARDKIQARKWMSIAFELGNEGARFERDKLASKMQSEEVAKADGLALLWLDSHQNMQASADLE